MRGPLIEASERAYVVEKILDRTIPGWAQNKPSVDKDFTWLRKQASRAKVAQGIPKTRIAQDLGISRITLHHALENTGRYKSNQSNIRDC